MTVTQFARCLAVCIFFRLPDAFCHHIFSRQFVKLNLKSVCANLFAREEQTQKNCFTLVDANEAYVCHRTVIAVKRSNMATHGFSLRER